MTESELAFVLSKNIKKFRGKTLTQEALAEKANLSVQLINAIECGRKWVSKQSLSKIADALGVEVYQLFVPQDTTPIIIDDTPKNERIRAKIQEDVIAKVRASLNKSLQLLVTIYPSFLYDSNFSIL